MSTYSLVRKGPHVFVECDGRPVAGFTLACIREALDAPTDPTNPGHYKGHPSGVECIEISERLPFCEGNAVKYLWRYRDKGGLEDLRKAEWYLKRAIARPAEDLDFRMTEPLSKWCVWQALNPDLANRAICEIARWGCLDQALRFTELAIEQWPNR